jgi:hypothetical protein
MIYWSLQEQKAFGRNHPIGGIVLSKPMQKALNLSSFGIKIPDRTRNKSHDLYYPFRDRLKYRN